MKSFGSIIGCRAKKMNVSAGKILLGAMLLFVQSAYGRPQEIQSAHEYRSCISFDRDWRFQLYPLGTQDEKLKLQSPDQDDSSWRKLNVPHDWAIEGDFQMDLPGRTGKLPYVGIGWYRKSFVVSGSDKGKRIFIDFDGAMSRTKVWLNGNFVGQWPYGYSSFRLELTPYINFGADNIIAVRLENPEDSARWYPGAGIYRHTWLVKTNPIHVGHWGTFVSTPSVTEAQAEIKAAATIHNQTQSDVTISLRQEVTLEGSSRVLASAQTDNIVIRANSSDCQTEMLAIKAPNLWGIESPMLYQLTTKVIECGNTVDVYRTPFGIRTTHFDAQKGFHLNGKRLYLKGVCLHHDLGPLGAAVHHAAIKRQLVLLKEMGCNAIRTAHNPPAPELLELCDRMGFVVIDEAFDCWAAGKMENDYHKCFDEWHEKDIVALVHRDRNHPSVVMWSSGNEVREQGDRVKGQAISRRLTAIFHREDPTRPVTVGCNNPNAAFNGLADTIDVFGYNYKPHLYAKFSRQRPHQPFYSSESASCISSRGEYFFPVSENKGEGFFNYQVSSYDLYAPPWAMAPDREFRGQDESSVVAGEFVWTGFDYLGEPTPYNRDATLMLNFHNASEKKELERVFKKMGGQSPSRSSYFGILDLCGFKKDRFYIYQARWRPEFPMVHILPHWNWPDRIGKITPVHVYTSGDEAELFLNGKSLGRKKKKPLTYRIRWDDVLYDPGTLLCVAYKNGKKWAENSVATTGEPSALKLTADRKTLDADGRDLSYITLEVVDREGRMVPRADTRVKFSVEGPAEIIATGNGNAIDHTSFGSLQRNAYNGMCLAIVRTVKGQTGTILICAESENVRSAEILLNSKGD